MTSSRATIVFPHQLRQELPYRCSACGADRGCDCDAPAIEKAATALVRSPEKSDRALAKEAGVGTMTISRARKATVPDGTVGKRVGLDGKTRRMPRARDAARALRDGLQAEFASRPRDANGMEPMGTPRDLILERLINDIGPVVVSPGSRRLSNKFLREVFEEFLLRREQALLNLYGEHTNDDELEGNE